MSILENFPTEAQFSIFEVNPSQFGYPSEISGVEMYRETGQKFPANMLPLLSYVLTHVFPLPYVNATRQAMRRRKKTPNLSSTSS
jgi:hypothetical protein